MIIYYLFTIFVALPDNGYASSWTLSMKHCKNSHPSTYLLGDIDLNNPHLVCRHIPHNLQLVWVAVLHQIHIGIDQGIYQILSFKF